MASTFSSLVTEVQARLGKADEAAGGLIGSTRVGIWVNQAIKDIVRAWPGLRDVHRLDKYTWKCIEDVYEYNLNDFKQYPVAHIIKIKYVDTTNDNYHGIEPYVGGKDQWDADYPYIPDEDTGEPVYYIRRGNTVEVYPMPGSDQAGAALWLEYSYLPADISSTSYPALTDFDEPIINHAMAHGLNAMDRKKEAMAQLEFANFLTQQRVDGEADFDEIDQMADNGP